jgi:hypothetical protein
VGVVLGLAVIAVVGWIVIAVYRQARTADDADQRAHDLAQLLADRPGGAPERALRVESAAEIEPRAEREPCPWCAGNLREPCPWCAGNLHVDTHEVEEHDPDLLRRVKTKCGSCGRTLTTWFHVHATLPN